MKDYIYLDTNLLNSNLAQLFEGLPVKSTEEDGQSENNKRRTDHTATLGVDVLPAGLGVSGKSDYTESTSESLTSSQKEVLESAFHDYSVDLLINGLNEIEDLITDGDSMQEGDIVLISDKFEILDFDYLETVTDVSDIRLFLNISESESIADINQKIEMLKRKNKTTEIKQTIQRLKKERNQVQEGSKEASETLKMLNQLSIYGKKLFPNTTIFKISNAIVLADKNLLRNNEAQISGLTDSEREVKILGIVSSIKEEVHSENNIMEDFKPNQIGQIPSIFNEVVLSSFDLLKSGDKMIKPIAIFFGE